MGADSQAAWLEQYPGGWQEIFPNGGPGCTYKGAGLGFHGEASMTQWDCEQSSPVEVRLTTRLARSPFHIERVMSVDARRPTLTIRERITNEGDEAMDYMWGHHPAYGEPFLSGDCRIDIGARSIRADDGYDPPFNPMELNRKYAWPVVERGGKKTDLSRVPGRDEPRAAFGYFGDFEGTHGWYAITNARLGFGLGMTWPAVVFPYAWFWQELSASSGYPWYRAARAMAIEPFTSYPGQGLAAVMEKTKTQRVLRAGETVAAEIRFVFFESKHGVRRIEPDGTVVVREE